MIIRNDKYKPPLNIVTYYGACESRTSREIIQENWNRFLKDLHRMEIKKEHIIIASYIFRRVGNDKFGIRGNTSEIFFGGLLVREFKSSGKYFNSNNTDSVIGGPFTCIDQSNS